MTHRYDVEWLDYGGKKARNWFFAASSADAIEVLEDLADISAASWTQLEEDGQPVTVTSPKFNQPATDQAYENEVAILEMRSQSSRSRHQLRLRAVLPAYVSEEERVSRENPFRNLGHILSSEGEPMAEFLRARYTFQNRKAPTT